MPRAQVFPGGRVDPADAAPGWDALVDMPAAAAARRLGTAEAADAPARAFLVGAAREVFEETGVLLGIDAGELPAPGWLESTRARVHGADETFAGALAAAGLRLRLAGMVPFARWVTPEALPKRYDTFFFAAEMPAGQEAVPAPGEIAALEWVAPAAALDRADSEQAYTLPPTRAALRALARFADVASALAGLGEQADLSPIMPRVVSRSESGIAVVMPGEPGYEEEV